MAETKTKAFRADEETIESIDQWAEAQGLRNNEILPALVRIAKMAEEKGKLTGRRTEIENFSSLLSQLESAYVASLNIASNADERIRNEFVVQLEHQGKTIQQLQEQVEDLKQLASIAKKELAEQKKANEALITTEAKARQAEAAAQRQVQKAEEQAAKAQNTAEELTSLTTSQAKEIVKLKQEMLRMDDLKEQLAESQDKLAKAQNSISSLNEKMDIAAVRAANDQQAAVLAAKADAQIQTDEIRHQFDELMKSYQSEISRKK